MIVVMMILGFMLYVMWGCHTFHPKSAKASYFAASVPFVMMGMATVGLIGGCQTRPMPQEQPKSVVLEPRYVEGMPLELVPDSDEPTFTTVKDAIVVDKLYQVWLRAEVAALTSPPKAILKENEQPFCVIYKAGGKYFVLTYGTAVLTLTVPEKDSSGREIRHRLLPIEKIAVIKDRKDWKPCNMEEAFKDTKVKPIQIVKSEE